MSGDLLSSKVVVVEEEPRVRGIPSAPTSVAAAVGITQRGPIDVAVLCSSFDEFQGRYGGFTPDADLALAAMGFFENGGTQLWCVRTVHHKSVDDPNTATALRAGAYLASPGAPTPARVNGTTPAPFALDDGAVLTVSIAGGPDLTATINAAAAFLPLGGPGPYALADGQTLAVRIDGETAQQVAFAAMDFVAIGAATPAEVAVSLNAKLAGAKAVVNGGVPRIVSDTKGTGSRVELVGGTASAALGVPAAPAVGKGNVANVHATTIAEVKTIAEAAIAGVVVSAAPGGFLDVRTVATGPTAQLQVRAATAAGFGLDTAAHTGSASGAANAVRVEGLDPGAYGNQLEAEVRTPASGELGAFDLAIIEDGTYRELFPSLRMTPSAARYVERIVNDPRAGSIVEVRAISSLLSGKYYVTAAKHAISSSGYTCDLKLSRDAKGKGAPNGAKSQTGDKNAAALKKAGEKKQVEMIDKATGESHVEYHDDGAGSADPEAKTKKGGG